MTIFKSFGAERFAGALLNEELELFEKLTGNIPNKTAGVRIRNDDVLYSLVASGSTIDKIAKSKLGEGARPVRALLFDKSESANWAVGWHQDRTIAVCERVDVPGFGPWSVKGGVTHVEPPFEYIDRMVTLRVHLDSCDSDNAPLLILPGSHRLGRMPADKVLQLGEDSEPFMCLAEPGDVWVIATAIIHASEAAVKPRRRRVLHIDYSADDLSDGLDWLGL